MVRKFILPVSLFLIVVLVGIGYFSITRNFSSGKMDPWKLVPADAAMVIVSDRLPDLANQLEYDSILRSSLTLVLGEKDYLLIDAIKQIAGMQNLVSDKNYIAFFSRGTGAIGWLFIGSISPNVKNFEEVFTKYGKSRNFEIQKRQFNFTKIIDFNSGEKTLLSVSKLNNFFLIGNSSVLLEDALTKRKRKRNDSSNKKLDELKLTASNQNINLYIHHAYFPGFLTKCFQAPWIQHFQDFGGWTELDIYRRKDLLMLSGYSVSADSGPSKVDVFSRQLPAANQLIPLFPAGTVSFYFINLSQIQHFLDDFNHKGINTALRNARVHSIESLMKNYSLDAQEWLIRYEALQIAQCKTADTGTLSQANVFQFLLFRDGEGASKVLEEIPAIGVNTDTKINNLVTTHVADDGTSFRIYRMQAPFLLKTLLGSLFGESENKYFTRIGNIIVFGNSIKSLAALLNDYVEQRSLFYKPEFNAFYESLDSSSNFSFYMRPGIHSITKAQYAVSGLMKAVALQLSNSGMGVFTNIVVQRNKPENVDSLTLKWKIKLANPLISPPWIVRNHNTDREEIFIQDNSYQVSLYSGNGKLQWTQNIPSAIIGNVFQADLFKNGKLQYVFITEDKLFVIDRNGNFVPPFPLKLPEKAISEGALIDFDKNREYRLYYPAKDSRIYCLDMQGKKVKGWEVPSWKGVLLQSIEHFRVGDLDYLVFITDQGIRFLNRKGQDRIQIHEPVQPGYSKIFLQKNGLKHSFVTIDRSGRLVTIQPDGSVQLRNLNLGIDSLQYHGGPAGNQSQRLQFLLKGDSILYLDNNFAIKASYPARIAPSEIWDIKELDHSQFRIILFSPSRSQANLITEKGKSELGFPREAVFPPQICSVVPGEGKFSLVLTDKNNFLYTFILD